MNGSFKKHNKRAPYIIVGVTCKAPLAPSDLAYVDTYLWSNSITITTNVTCASWWARSTGGDILGLWGLIQLPPYRRTHFTRMAPHLEALPYTSCANSVEQYCSRVVERDHHLHNVNDFNTFLIRYPFLGRVLNFVGLLFLGKETISIPNCGANECHLCLDV